ncbi:MAG: pseudomurein-binding protein [Methanobacterium sp.]|nr:pseudomurein-binding protein [Methanobacterium sp.]
MERLTLKQYREMVTKIIEFKKLNGEMPPYAIVNGCKITKSAYVDMIETTNKFLLEMGRNPEIVEIGKSQNNINCNTLKF